MTQPTERLLPVLIGDDYEHLMTRCTVDEEPGKTTVTIVAEGEASKYLADFLTAAEPIALSFAGIPVQPRKNQSKEH